MSRCLPLVAALIVFVRLPLQAAENQPAAAGAAGAGTGAKTEAQTPPGDDGSNIVPAVPPARVVLFRFKLPNRVFLETPG